MKKVLDDVRAFHRACDLPVFDVPSFPDDARCKLRDDLLEEEHDEYKEGMAERNIVKVADALADMVYIIAGTALEYGIPLDRVWEVVQSSNMAKVDTATGKVRKREDGKVLKPENWEAPKISEILAHAAAK